jgi:hypothetical protein
MSRFSEIFDKLIVTEDLEGSKSSEEMIDQNTTTLNDMGYAHVEPGKFDSDERTDLDNVDKNRAEQPDSTGSYSSQDTSCTDHPEECDCPECLAKINDEDSVLAKEILGVGTVTFESKFAQAFDRVLAESDYVGVKNFNHDLRVTANQVLRRLKAELPTAIGLHVDQDIDANQNNKFLVSGPDWEKQGIELPKTLDVENVKLKLLPEKDLYRFVYVIDDTNSDYPLIK